MRKCAIWLHVLFNFSFTNSVVSPYFFALTDKPDQQIPFMYHYASHLGKTRERNIHYLVSRHATANFARGGSKHTPFNKRMMIQTTQQPTPLTTCACWNMTSSTNFGAWSNPHMKPSKLSTGPMFISPHTEGTFFFVTCFDGGKW